MAAQFCVDARGIVGEHNAPTIRVGTHHATAVQRDGDWFDLAVNVAARVAALAAGGEVLLTTRRSGQPESWTASRSVTTARTACAT